jgi:hypothetical protein
MSDYTIIQNKPDYTEQDGCHNCKNCFMYQEHDESEEYYCNINNDRPKCGSVFLGESFDGTRDEYDAWGEWGNNNKVKPWGICNKFDKE